jgi:hypothetical protein
LKWVDEGYEMLVFTDSLCQSDDDNAKTSLQRELSRADILVIVAVTNEESVLWIESNSKSIQNIICFDSSHKLENKLGGSYVGIERKGKIFDKIVGLSRSNESVEVVRTVSEAWDRHNSGNNQCLYKAGPNPKESEIKGIVHPELHGQELWSSDTKLPLGS